MAHELAAWPLCALLCSGLKSSVCSVELLWLLNEIINERCGLYIVSKYLLLGSEDDFLIKKLLASRVNLFMEAG